MLSLVKVKAGVYCMPWHVRGAEREAVHGGRCCYCEREISVPDSKRGWNAACCYCGLERGELPMTEAEAYPVGTPVSFVTIFET